MQDGRFEEGDRVWIEGVELDKAPEFFGYERRDGVMWARVGHWDPAKIARRSRLVWPSRIKHASQWVRFKRWLGRRGA